MMSRPSDQGAKAPGAGGVGRGWGWAGWLNRHPAAPGRTRNGQPRGAPGRKPTWLWVAGTVWWLLAGGVACRPGADSGTASASKLPPALETAAVERGRAIAGQAFTLLSTNLARALAEGGLTNALPYCSERAYPLTELVAATNRVRLQRITHKPRNPTNAPAAGELAVLRGFQLALGRGQTPAPVVRATASNTVVVYSPIVITNPLCLQCHGVPGRDLPPTTLALLQTLYPQDQATGFQLGDLRGAWRVEFDRVNLESPGR